jgi:hypothetical protein
MLTSLLPGLRQLRTPMAAGAVLVFAIILAVGVETFSGAVATGLAKDVGTLVSAMGRTAALTGLAFGAYLVGVIWQSLFHGLVRACQQYLGPRTQREVFAATSRAVFAGMSKRMLGRLDDAVGARLRQEVDAQDTDHKVEYRSALNKLVEDNRSDDATRRLILAGAMALRAAAARQLLELVPTRLAAGEKDLWGHWDQARTEAEFRFTLAIPLAVLASVLAVVYHPMWWLGVLSAPMLLRIAGESGQRATEVLLEAVRADKVKLFDGATLPTVRYTVTATAGGHEVLAKAV